MLALRNVGFEFGELESHEAVIDWVVEHGDTEELLKRSEVVMGG